MRSQKLSALSKYCKRSIAILLFATFALHTSALGQCHETSLETLKKKAANAGKPLKLVFFSSWCPSCKDSLDKNSKDDQVLFVASFDNREAANKVARKYALGEQRCIFDVDDALSRQLEVSGVPAERTIKG